MVKGSLNAEDKSELARELRGKGLVLISAKDEEEDKSSFNFTLPFLNNVSIKEKLMLTRNLKVMISAGLALPRALQTLAAQSQNKKLKEVLEDIRKNVIKGEEFSSCLEKHSDVFSDLFVSMVKVGEASGKLEEVLEVLSRQMERNHELKSEIMGALIYPAVIILAMMGIGMGMLVFVVPKISETFEQLDAELPQTTQFVIGLGNALSTHWYLFLAGAAAAGLFFYYFLRTKLGKKITGYLGLKLPLISPLVKKISSAYSLRSLSSLIKAGVSLPKGLGIIAGTTGNLYYKKALIHSSKEIKKGVKLSEVLGEYDNLYPPLVIEMIAVGEETGETSNILEKLADFYEAEVTNATKNLASVIEPVVMLLIGGAVGFFAISMIQPMYSMLSAV